MSKNLEESIIRWISPNLSNPGDMPSSLMEHIDYLLGRWPKNSEWISLSLDAFLILIEQLKVHNLPAKPVLHIPLQSIGNKLSLSVPNNISEVTSQLSKEPPSLGIVSWQASCFLKVIEEYKKPLDFSFFTNQITEIYAYYHEYRFGSDLTNNWEFSRRISIEYFPKNTFDPLC